MATGQCAAVAVVALALAGCASTDAVETAALGKTPIAAGKARVTITRVGTLQYAAAPATITLNGQKVASVANGGTAVVDVPAGANVLAASAWSYPGEYKVKLNAEPGKTYALEVSPRSDSLGPSILLGPIGGMIDSATNENAGAFEMRVVGAKSAASGGGRKDGPQLSGRELLVVDVTAPLGRAEDMVRERKEKVFPNREARYVRMDAQGKTVAVV